MNVTITLSRRDVGRLLVGVRERRKKLQRGLDKFADNFDPTLGVNITEGFAAYSDLEKRLNEALV
jgi:hypothetical protein